MHPETLARIKSYREHIARINNVDPDHIARGGQFTVSAEPEQALRAAIVESSAFLGLVTYRDVDNQSGEVIDIGTTTTIAGRTDTSSTGVRTPADPTGKDKDTYACVQTNYDVALRYDALDAWRHFPNFQSLWSGAVATQMGLDELMIGFNGASAAATTNRTTYPLLQDVNIGWIQKMRAGNAARWLTEGEQAEDEIRIGTEDGADYRNLDELVFDLVGLLHPQFQEDPRLRVILGRSLIRDKYLTFQGGSAVDAPTERAALEQLMLNKKLGGIPAMAAPYFPSRAVLVTIPANLQIIEQRGTRRRTIVDHAAKDQMEDFNSINQAFGIGRFEAAAGCENITYFDEGTWEATP